MSELLKDINNAAAAAAEKCGFLLVDTVLKGDSRMHIVQIFIDNKTGVTTEDCKLMSSEVADIIESSALIKSSYRLEISSPGVDRPLKYLEQYHKHVNRKFEIEFGEAGQTSTVTGKLLNVDGEDLTFLTDGGEVVINFNKIKAAKVLISF